MNALSQMLVITLMATVTGALGFYLSVEYAPFMKRPTGIGLEGQWITFDGRGGSYYSGIYKYPLSDNIPVALKPPPVVGLYPQFMARLAKRGDGYAPNSTKSFTVESGSGTGMLVTADTDADGRITSASITEMGAGYLNNEIVTITGNVTGANNAA